MTFSTERASVNWTKPNPRDLPVFGSVFNVQSEIVPNCSKYSRRSSESNQANTFYKSRFTDFLEWQLL